MKFLDSCIILLAGCVNDIKPKISQDQLKILWIIFFNGYEYNYKVDPRSMPVIPANPYDFSGLR